MSDRTVASVWAAEGCAFTSACETHARFNVPGAENSVGSKPGSVIMGANADVGTVTATEADGAATASLVGDKFGCQLHVNGQQVGPLLHIWNTQCAEQAVCVSSPMGATSMLCSRTMQGALQWCRAMQMKGSR